MKLGTNIGLGFLESFTSSLMVFVRYVSRILRNRNRRIVLSMAQVEYPYEVERDAYGMQGICSCLRLLNDRQCWLTACQVELRRDASV